MVAATADRNSSGRFVLGLDVGTSSVRTLLFDDSARQVEGLGVQLPYRVTTTPDGGVEVDSHELLSLAVDCLSATHQQLEQAGIRPAAIAFSAFWHSFLGVSQDGEPTTPLIHLFETRSAQAAIDLASIIDQAASHKRTGCVLHASYWPAKLLWLSQTVPVEFQRTAQWLSFGEFLFLKLFGSPSTSTSMVSGSGIWNQNRNTYDEEMLSVLPLRIDQVARVEDMDEPRSKLDQDFAAKWPRFDGIPWYPALGDGACNNIGSGSITLNSFTLMVGTSGAMRAVFESDQVDVPPGLWCYRVDRRRFVLGGALSNGGEVFAWMQRTLALPDPAELEQRISEMEPGGHGLTVLPLFAGERSTKWRAHARAAITGMSLHTGPVEIVRASLEAVALRFREIYELMVAQIGEPNEVIASGGALLRSQAWTQMMADALGRPVRPCLEPEASGRGAALLALERLGVISHIRELPAQLDQPQHPVEQNRAAYDKLLAGQRHLYAKLFEENA